MRDTDTKGDEEFTCPVTFARRRGGGQSHVQVHVRGLNGDKLLGNLDQLGDLLEINFTRARFTLADTTQASGGTGLQELRNTILSSDGNRCLTEQGGQSGGTTLAFVAPSEASQIQELVGILMPGHDGGVSAGCSLLLDRGSEEASRLASALRNRLGWPNYIRGGETGGSTVSLATGAVRRLSTKLLRAESHSESDSTEHERLIQNPYFKKSEQLIRDLGGRPSAVTILDESKCRAIAASQYVTIHGLSPEINQLDNPFKPATSLSVTDYSDVLPFGCFLNVSITSRRDLLRAI